jgi:2-amino-4-hydroxy-6-hydroxymethyldihydropteridine diphosphokinase
MPEIIFLTGSNIDPVANTHRALLLLKDQMELIEVSTPWETKAVGSIGPNFINLAVRAGTNIPADRLKTEIFRPVEAILGRIRTDDKNAPRTIDLDLIIYDAMVFDANLWEKAFIAIPVAELAPDQQNPVTGQILRALADRLCDPQSISPRPDRLCNY